MCAPTGSVSQWDISVGRRGVDERCGAADEDVIKGEEMYSSADDTIGAVGNWKRETTFVHIDHLACKKNIKHN